MPNRRAFLRTVVGGATGMYVMSRAGTGSAVIANQSQSPRREVMVADRRVKVIDVHAHCVIPVPHIVKGPFIGTSRLTDTAWSQ